MTHEVIEAPAAALVQKPAPPASASQPTLSVVQYAMQSGATPAELRELLALQRETDNHQLVLIREKRQMDEEDRKLAAKQAFDAAMTDLRGKNIIIPRTKEVVQTARGGGPGPRFKQSEFDVVCRMLSPALNACGLSFNHDMRFGSKKWATDGVENDIPWVYVTCHLTHRDGHAEKLELEGPPDSSGSKNPLQEMQSTASYLKRQSLLAITGTATGGEDDENGMRRKATRREPVGGADEAGQADECETMLDAGRAEAMKGMKSLTAWWGALTAKQRTTMNSEFGGLRRCAAQADGGAQ